MRKQGEEGAEEKGRKRSLEVSFLLLQSLCLVGQKEQLLLEPRSPCGAQDC